MVGDDGRARVLDFGLSRGRGDWARSQIAIDMYHPGHVELLAPAGLTIGPPR